MPILQHVSISPPYPVLVEILIAGPQVCTCQSCHPHHPSTSALPACCLWAESEVSASPWRIGLSYGRTSLCSPPASELQVGWASQPPSEILSERFCTSLQKPGQAPYCFSSKSWEATGLQAVWRPIVRVIAMGTQRRQRARFAWLQAVRVRIVCRDFILIEPAKIWACFVLS